MACRRDQRRLARVHQELIGKNEPSPWKVKTLSSSLGKSLEEVVAAKPTADYEAKWGGFVVDGIFFTRLVYAGV